MINRATLIEYIYTLPAMQVDNLIENLIAVSDLLITDNFQQHVAIEDLLSDIHQRFELIG